MSDQIVDMIEAVQRPQVQRLQTEIAALERELEAARECHIEQRQRADRAEAALADAVDELLRRAPAAGLAERRIRTILTDLNLRDQRDGYRVAAELLEAALAEHREAMAELLLSHDNLYIAHFGDPAQVGIGPEDDIAAKPARRLLAAVPRPGAAGEG